MGSIILLCSSRFDNEIIFKNEFEEIDKEMIQKVVPDYMERFFYLCSPSKMVDAMVVILKDFNIFEKQIKQEYSLDTANYNYFIL